MGFLENNKDNVIIKKVYKERINKWLKNSVADYEIRIINEFIKNHTDLLHKISKYLILRGYSKEMQQEIIGDIVFDLDKIRIKEEPFIADGMDTIDVQRNIKIYLNQRSVQDLSKEDILSDIDHLSGLFYEELQYVYYMLKYNQNILDSEVLQKVRKKFKGGSKIDILFEEKLSNIIPPKAVDSPENITTLEEWISWAINSYLPYKFWMEENDIYNNKIDQYSLMYGDWVYKNYGNLIASSDKMIYKALAIIGRNIKEDELSIVVMIDNFNYKYVQLCKSYFYEKGYSTTLDQPLISMIPTETSVSKSAFFSGQPFNLQQKSYETMCKEWEVFFNGRVQYLSDIGKLDSVNDKNAKLYILNYLSIDKILHDSQNNAALPISYRIREELKAAIDKIINFGKRLGYENSMKIYFVSDHGSTKILKEQENLIDPKYYKAKTEDCAYRVISILDKNFKTYKDSIGHLCYVLDRNAYGMKENYFIARGYNRFMETDLSFYVHGGITPEENIVPLLKFERVEYKLIQPELVIRNNEFRYSSMNSIKLLLKNYNEYPIEKIELTIMNPNIRWDDGIYMLDKIDKESQTEIFLNKVRIMRKHDSYEKLNIRMKYIFLGKEYDKNYEFDIKVKATQESTFDFNDL